mgnify:CR=1 FL=1
MASVIEGMIEKFINAIKSFVNAIENLSQKAITQIGTFARKAGDEIFALMKNIFETAKAGISRLIQSFQDQIRNFQRRIRTPSNRSGEGISSRIKKYLKEGYEKMSNITKNFGEKVIIITKEIGEVLERTASGIGSGVEKGFGVAKTIAKESVKKLSDLGKLAVEETKSAVKSFSKETEIAGEFIFKHDIEIATASSFGILENLLPCLTGFALGGLIVYAATQYKPEEDKN